MRFPNVSRATRASRQKKIQGFIRPVFEALFQDYHFATNNTVSQSMQRMLDMLESEEVDKETSTLDDFYQNVRQYVGKIDNLEGKQAIIKTLYEKFFKGAFPKTVDKLGIVYTPMTMRRTKAMKCLSSALPTHM